MAETFESWLKKNGAEILPVSNQYELVRFKGQEVGVLYKSGKYSNEYAKQAYIAFKSGNKWNGRPISTGRKNTYRKEKLAMLKRDGNKCFYCDKLLNGDITAEHLIPLSSGGKNSLSNMVLAHEKCNHEQGHKTIVEKVKFAIENRKQKL